MAICEMRVVPEPAEGREHVIEGPKDAPIQSGNGPDNHLCGACNTLLLHNVRPEEVKNTIYLCSACGAFNVISTKAY